MFSTVTIQDWENLVKKQLKVDDIQVVLNKENLEGITIKPYYNHVEKPLKNLPKVEESTHLVAQYHESLVEHAFAFLTDKDVDVEEKTVFFTNHSVQTNSNNSFVSLVDVFDEKKAVLNQELANELLNKNCKRNICVDVSLHQNAGASIIQQLSIALAKTKELCEIFGKDVLSKIIIKIAVGGQYFFEIAKIRALKLLFNQLSKEYGLDEIPYIFAETSLRNKAINDEENNLIRSTLEIASAMIAGSDAVYSNNYKMINATELSEEISFKQQVVLAYESIINVFEDAANGSFYVEDITQQFAEQSWKKFLEIEEQGGYLENLKSEIIQKEIYNQAIAEQNWVSEGKIKLIGVNLYPKLEQKKSIEEMYSESEINGVRIAEMFE